MSINYIFIYCVTISFVLTSIYAIKENDKKFLSLNPVSFLNEAPEMKSFSEDDPKFINIKCLYSKDYNIYSLQKLENDEKDYEIEHEGETIAFNFCRNTKKSQDATFIKYNKDNDTNVTRLSGSIEGDGENINTWNQILNKTGVVIHFTQGDKCQGNEKHQVILEIICNSDIDDSKFKENPSHYLKILNSSDPCNHKFEMESLYGCSLKSSYLLKQLIEDYKIIFAILFILVGLLLCFMGNNILAITLIIVGGVAGCYLITAFVLNAFPQFITSESYLFLCMGVSLVLGCLIGFLLKGDVQMAIIFFGGYLGYSCTIFVYQIVLNYVEFDAQIVYYTCIGVCIVLGVVISWKLNRAIIILGTAVFGGYVAMRGVSFFAGNYLDEGYILDLLKSKEFERLKQVRNSWTYVYLGAWVLLSLIGVIVQCKNKDKVNGKKKSK